MCINVRVYACMWASVFLFYLSSSLTSTDSITLHSLYKTFFQRIHKCLLYVHVCAYLYICVELYSYICVYLCWHIFIKINLEKGKKKNATNFSCSLVILKCNTPSKSFSLFVLISTYVGT